MRARRRGTELRLPALLRTLSYRRSLRLVANALRLRGILKKAYYALVRPREGILQLEVGGKAGRFRVSSAGELRLLDQHVQPESEQRILRLLMSSVRPGDVVYDVGAHVGLYTIFLARAVGETGVVVAFEPAEQNHTRLLDNVELNGLTNVRAFMVALAEESGLAVLFHEDESTKASLLRHCDRPGQIRETVRIVNGDEFIGSAGLPPPCVVKIDVEGYEYAVLKGLRRALAQPICRLVDCEIHPNLLPGGLCSGDIVDILRSVGFKRITTTRCREVVHILAYKE